MKFYTYILFNKSANKYYIGHSQDPEKRLIDHNKKNHKVKFTRKTAGQWSIVYKEEFSTRSEAMMREKEIKKKKCRVYIEYLISSK